MSAREQLLDAMKVFVCKHNLREATKLTVHVGLLGTLLADCAASEPCQLGSKICGLDVFYHSDITRPMIRLE